MAAMTHEITVYDEDYPARRLLELIGDKWTPIIVYILGQGTKRYGEMQRHLPGVSKKMLTQTLRALEGNGLLKRRVYAEVPPRPGQQRRSSEQAEDWATVIHKLARTI